MMPLFKWKNKYVTRKKNLTSLLVATEYLTNTNTTADCKVGESRVKTLYIIFTYL